MFERMLSNARSVAQRALGEGTTVTAEPPAGSEQAGAAELTLSFAVVGDIEVRYEPSMDGTRRVQRRTLTLNMREGDTSYCGYPRSDIPERTVFTIADERWQVDGQPATEGDWVVFDLVRVAYRERSRREFRR